MIDLLLAETLQAGFWGQLIVAVGLLVLSAVLFKPKENKPLLEDAPSTTTERGTFIPLVMGKREVGEVVLWVGGRIIITEECEGGGKKGGKGGDCEIDVYFEQGVHAVAVGPIHALHGIFRDGELLEGSQGLNHLNTPSGTTLDFGDKGSCRIYWGFLDNPGDSLWQSKLGIASNMPYVMYVVWDRARLGMTPRWSRYKYRIEQRPINNSPGFTTWIDDNESAGMSPAYALWQLISAPFPHGCGLSGLNDAALQALAGVVNGEHLPVNLVIADGEEAQVVISQLMDDIGFALPQCPSGQLAPLAIREVTEEVQELTDDLLEPPYDEIVNVHANLLSDALVYEYADEQHNFRTGTIDVDDDSVAATRNRRKTQKHTLFSVTHRKIASKVVKRRQTFDLSDPTNIRLTALRGIRDTLAGQVFDHPSLGKLRVLGVKPNFKTPSVELDTMRDLFDQTPIVFTDPDLPGGEVLGDLEPDLRFAPYELPIWLSPSQQRIVLFRHRDNASISQSAIHSSLQNINYSLIGTQNAPCAGGVLLNAWGHRSVFEETGPIVVIDNNGDETIPVNLSGDLDSYYGGAQVMLVCNPISPSPEPDIDVLELLEVCFVRDWQLVDEPMGHWHPVGILRARFDTIIPEQAGNWREHPAGSWVFIIQQFNLFARYAAQSFAYHKSQPANPQGQVPLPLVMPKKLPLYMKYSRPAVPCWVQCGGDGGTGVSRRDGKYYPGNAPGDAFSDDIILEWLWSDTTLQPLPTGSGFQPYGTPVSVNASPPGEFVVRVYDQTIDPDSPPVLVREVTGITAPDADGVMRWTYTRDDRATDGLDGGEMPQDGDWWIELIHKIDGVESPPTLFYPEQVDEDTVPRPHPG